ncbi:MAG TPA: indole-3-glycerol phosphate synthase TrpC [Solirubrobacteraceae bacterium]|nr:indole-3-glycerol phosphate synthase TrpC [Solirubrobacteraceae bacterium]
MSAAPDPPAAAPAAAPPDVLAEIIGATRRRIAAACAPSTRFSAALTAGRDEGRVALIAEHKRASPSAGTIRDDLELADVVGAYERAGAAALSVLTEPERFGGRLADITAVRSVTGLPILRKDFIVDPIQVHEAAVAGADAILLIVAAFPGRPAELAGLAGLAGRLGLEVLMEVHDASELEIALELEAPIIGINNRDLSTLRVDLETTFALRPRIPAGTVVVAESGFSTPEQIRALAAAEVDAVLMGEALMRSADIAAAARAIATATPGG